MKFACIPVKFAPKRKLVNFALPKWRQKLAELEDPDVKSWVNDLYQTRMFPSREEFNKAYDEYISTNRATADVLFWTNKPMTITKEDFKNFESEFNDGAFDESRSAVEKLIGRMRAVLETGEKVVFVY
jgi:hypothetical protein